MLFAVGDGNHSLATAKECYERQKRLTPPEHWATLPARYALCELNNLHDPALEFEPIHRVVFGVDVDALLDALGRFYPNSHWGKAEAGERGHCLHYVSGDRQGDFTVLEPKSLLPVGTLQSFLDDYLAATPRARVDYIHGAQVATKLAGQARAVAFLLPPMDKNALFPTVLRDGALPRKTFSIGEAHDKRFYLEARKIRD
jgi:uncharacterized protein (DUF1015 family)